MDCRMPGLHVHHKLPEFTQTHVHLVSDAIQPSHPLSSLSPPAFNLSRHQGLFQWVYLFVSGGQGIKSFSFNISPSNEYSGLISFRMGWLDLLAAQGTLKSLLQHHSSKASILQHSAFFIVQLSHPYLTTGKTIALTRQTFVGGSRVPKPCLPFSTRSLDSAMKLDWLECQRPDGICLSSGEGQWSLSPMCGLEDFWFRDKNQVGHKTWSTVIRNLLDKVSLGDRSQNSSSFRGGQARGFAYWLDRGSRETSGAILSWSRWCLNGWRQM